MNTTAAPERLGLVAEQLIQEFGWDDDVDEAFRQAVEQTCGAALEDEDYTGIADAALLWWRDDDGDLTDALVDMVAVIDEGGAVLLLTPKPGRAGAVDPTEIDEASSTAGLHVSGTVAVGEDWRCTKLVAPKSTSRR